MAINSLFGTKGIVAGLTIALITTMLYFVEIETAEAIPAFARKYQANCALCHSNEPRLTPFGQKFLSNGYQFPGTQDGDSAGKIVLDGAQGPATVDQLSNMMAVRVRADISRSSFNTAPSNTLEDTVIDVPGTVNVYFAGTVTKNISYMLETQIKEILSMDRGYLQFSNVGGVQGAVNVKVGQFDPASLYSFPTHRQQINPIGPRLANNASGDEKAEADTITDVYRIPLVPLAFTYKMYGLKSTSGTATKLLLPFQPSLYNAPSQSGISVHGRPFGDNHGFLYQVGLAQNTDTSGLQRTDTYFMGRYDFDAGGIATQVSGFYYQAPDAASFTVMATPANSQGTTDITRMGIGARAQWDEFDIYGTYVTDKIDVSTAMMPSMWEEAGSALSLEGDWRFDPNWMVGVRYDQMSPGGMKAMAIDSSFLALIGKYYPSPNIAFYASYHQNLEDSTVLMAGAGGQHPAVNLRNTALLGVDMAF